MIVGIVITRSLHHRSLGMGYLRCTMDSGQWYEHVVQWSGVVSSMWEKIEFVGAAGILRSKGAPFVLLVYKIVAPHNNLVWLK